MNQLTKRQQELLLNNKEDLKAIVYAYDADKLVLFDEFAKQFEEKKKDWEIINYRTYSDNNHIHKHPRGVCTTIGTCYIHSVKYKDQVFTVDEMTDKGRIRAFVLRENELKVHVLHGALFDISEVKKVERKALLVTEDGIEIFEDYPDLYYVDDSFQLGEIINLSNETYQSYKKKGYKFFKSKEKAEEYILLNSPKLSVNECVNQVIDELNQWAYFSEDPKKLAMSRNMIQDRLTSLVKSKSK